MRSVTFENGYNAGLNTIKSYGIEKAISEFNRLGDRFAPKYISGYYRALREYADSRNFDIDKYLDMM